MANRLRQEQHLVRAARHDKIGRLLSESGDEWGAVALFYGAYHRVKAALITDPIWDDIGQLQAIHSDLVPDDRLIERHRGRRRSGAPREWGINELVQTLYPEITRAYERLHQASISVRYGVGLREGALGDLAEASEEIKRLYDQGKLSATLRWTDDGA